MTSLPMYGPGALANLADRIAYEAWLLEAVYAIVEQELFPADPDAVIYPLDSTEAICFGYMRGNIVIGDWKPRFLEFGAPLVFVSTFKLLDMFVEWVLEENGIRSTFRFQEKIRSLGRAVTFPPVVETREWLRERIIGLYRTLEPLRGTIIHDRHFGSVAGAVRVSSSKAGVIGPTVEVGPADLRRLALCVISVLKYVTNSWNLDVVREKTLRHHLDEIAHLHSCPLLGQRLPYHTCVRLYLTGLDPLRFDPETIRGNLVRTYVDRDCSFDIRVLMVEDREVVDAYLLPWSLFEPRGTNWKLGLDVAQYRTAIPADISLEHLGTDAG